MKSASLLLVVALATVIPLVSQSPAQSTAQGSTDSASGADDPPNRVARLNWLTGDVSFQPAGLEEWTSATLNYPLTTSDHLFTGDVARVEMHIGSNALRLDSNSNFGFLNLDDNIVQVSLTEGSLEIRLRQLADDDSFEVATPNGAVTLLRTGDYRIDTNAERDATMLTVRAGQAELFSGANSVIVRAEETAYFQADQNADVRSANDRDDFDSFATAREDSGKGSLPADVPVADLVTEGVTGAEDLNNYGSWQSTAQYGQAWVPPVDPDWVPYSDGDWAYVEPWGWTWIDSAPWGFAPFHYGRWAFANSRWVWIPGAKEKTPVYAPALVTFIGGGQGGNVSWFALGPRDPWIPPWRMRTDSTAPPVRVSSNRWVPGAVSSISQREFIAGGRVKPGSSLLPGVQVLGSSPLIAPVRESLLVGAVRPPPPARNRPLILRTGPPPAPISFAAKVDSLTRNQGRPLAPGQIEGLRRQVPAAVMARPAVRYTKPLVVAPRAATAPVKPQAGRPNAVAPR